MDEYREAVEEFNRVYRQLKKYKELRRTIHTSMYEDGWIEVREFQGDKPGKCICRVTDEDDANLYRMATRDLERILKSES